jgi:hypothetical protein
MQRMGVIIILDNDRAIVELITEVLSDAGYVVRASDQLERTDITVRSERTVQPNTFWLGHEDHAELPIA